MYRFVVNKTTSNNALITHNCFLCYTTGSSRLSSKRNTNFAIMEELENLEDKVASKGETSKSKSDDSNGETPTRNNNNEVINCYW